jgi:VWFA-related protein
MNLTMHRHLGTAFVCLSLGMAAAQAPPAQAPPAAAPQQPSAAKPAAEVAEMSSKDEPATFRSRVNLVMVPVVVRDKQGRAIGNLRQEDFQLFDRGKAQVISRFSVERPGSMGVKSKGDREGKNPKAADANMEIPERFVAYLFDDIHLNFGNLVQVRNSASRHIETALKPTDRAAIFTTSGQVGLEFTDDREKLNETLRRLQPRPVAGPLSRNSECPDVSYYMGDMIQNHNDPSALEALVQETFVCANLDPATMRSTAESMVRSAASRAAMAGSHETRLALSMLRDAIRRMASTPGQRIIVLASPGFITPEDHQETMDVMDRAIRANVTINTVDARGLYTDPSLDASRVTYSSQAMLVKSGYDRDEARAQSDVLAELSHGTGGTFFQNSNDLDEAFRRTAEAPEYYYLLGFSPQNLKLDGSFHPLKVSLAKTVTSVNSQARRGYYAPKHLTDAAETAREEIREALFSREELRELPVDMKTQFFKPSLETARLTLLVHFDLKGVKFRKAEGRNYNNVTIVTGLFDRNGNYVVGVQKTVEMRLLDATVVARAETGFTLRNTFDVKPGAYRIRLVVRDTEGQQITAQDGAIEIP